MFKNSLLSLVAAFCVTATAVAVDITPSQFCHAGHVRHYDRIWSHANKYG